MILLFQTMNFTTKLSDLSPRNTMNSDSGKINRSVQRALEKLEERPNTKKPAAAAAKKAVASRANPCWWER